jgi:hypothetical protein
MNLRFNQLMNDNVVEASLLVGRSPAGSGAQRQLVQSTKVTAFDSGNRELLANSSV